MRAIIAALIVAAGASLAGAAGTLAAPGGADIGTAGPPGVVQPAHWGGGYCERLRRACIYKEERGEWGYGHCRRYREECGGRVSYCERLRLACIYKEERGEWGYGNCRRYREECGYYRRYRY
jgi:hypothetical protein